MVASLGRPSESALGYLRCIKQSGAIFGDNGIDQDGMGDTGDEVSDILMTPEWRQGTPVSFVSR